jgi:hypothetical protein
MKILTRKVYIIVQIENDSIIIAHGKRWGNTIYITYNMTQTLNNQEITHESITNPTKIVSLIYQELQKYHVKNGVMIASIPFIQEPNMPTILQIALVLGKCNVPLIHLTNQPIITTDSKKITLQTIKSGQNLLDCILTKHYQTAHWWFAGSALGLCLMAIIFFSAHQFYTDKKNDLEHAFCAISYKTKQCDSNDMSKKMLRLEKESETMRHTLSLLKQSSKSQTQLDMLIAIAQATPTNSWLENLSLTSTSSQKSAGIYIVDMKGCTNNPQEPGDIINHLSQRYAMSTLSLKKIQKQGHTSSKPLYAFVIKGKLGEKRV